MLRSRSALSRETLSMNLMRWISRSMSRVVGEARLRPSVHHVDGTHLADTDFWASASMRFDDTPLDNFCATLPRFPLGSAPLRQAGKLDHATRSA